MKNNGQQAWSDPSERDVEPLVITNDKENFMGHGDDSAIFHPQKFLRLSSLPVIDQASLELIEVLRLHKAIDRTRCATGSALLLRSLIRPGADLHHIQSKQEALREIAANDRLRGALADYVNEFKKGESALYKFFNKDLYALFPYLDLKKARRSAANMTHGLPTIPTAESPFLRCLISQLHTYR